MHQIAGNQFKVNWNYIRFDFNCCGSNTGQTMLKLQDLKLAELVKVDSKRINENLVSVDELELETFQTPNCTLTNSLTLNYFTPSLPN